MNADLGVHDRRSRRSRSPISVFTIADLGVHNGAISVFTISRSRCSRSSEIRR